MLVASSLGAGGTLILAGATLISVRQQTVTVEKIQREREKPMVIDEIVQVLNHAIEGAEFNIKAKKEEDWTWNWVITDGPQSHYVAGRVAEVINSSADPVALHRLQESDSELWDELVEYEQRVEEMAKLGDEIAEKIRPRIEEFVRQHDIRNANDEKPDIDNLVYGAVKQLDYFGESSKLYDVWESYGEEIRELSLEEAGEELESIDNKEQRLVSHSEKLLPQLRERKIKLRQEYGVSQRELDQASTAYSPDIPG